VRRSVFAFDNFFLRFFTLPLKRTTTSCSYRSPDMVMLPNSCPSMEWSHRLSCFPLEINEFLYGNSEVRNCSPIEPSYWVLIPRAGASIFSLQVESTSEKPADSASRGVSSGKLSFPFKWKWTPQFEQSSRNLTKICLMTNQDQPMRFFEGSRILRSLATSNPGPVPERHELSLKASASGQNFGRLYGPYEGARYDGIRHVSFFCHLLGG